jgi:hypothetical protein
MALNIGPVQSTSIAKTGFALRKLMPKLAVKQSPSATPTLAQVAWPWKPPPKNSIVRIWRALPKMATTPHAAPLRELAPLMNVLQGTLTRQMPQWFVAKMRIAQAQISKSVALRMVCALHTNVHLGTFPGQGLKRSIVMGGSAMRKTKRSAA